jgi:hypothetical protein
MRVRTKVCKGTAAHKEGVRVCGWLCAAALCGGVADG